MCQKNEMQPFKRCGMCHKTVIQVKDNEGKVQNTEDIFIDKWGGERYFCKECMKRKGNRQMWKF